MCTHPPRYHHKCLCWGLKTKTTIQTPCTGGEYIHFHGTLEGRLVEDPFTSPALRAERRVRQYNFKPSPIQT